MSILISLLDLFLENSFVILIDMISVIKSIIVWHINSAKHATGKSAWKLTHFSTGEEEHKNPDLMGGKHLLFL